MQKTTKQAIQKLQTETNHVLTVEDFDVIDELDALSIEISSVSKTERRLLNSPYELCGLKFYPLTVAKSLWFAEKCDEWELKGIYQESLLFWLLTLENSEAALDTFALRKDADKAIKRLSRKLHCTQEELTEVYNKCLGITDKSKPSDGKATDYGGMIAVLLREYGGKPNEWLYETPVIMISTLFKAYADKVNAEQNAHRSASASNGKAIAPQWNQKMQTLQDFREKVNAIREIWSVE